MSKKEIAEAERQIDEAFKDSKLIELGYTQAVWTLLSVVEDHYFKNCVYRPLDEKDLAIYTDGLINALTYPMQVLNKESSSNSKNIIRKLIDDDYDNANEWIDKAEDYTHFCSIFPLFHNNEIDLQISGFQLITTDWTTYDLSYEVYDRFVKKRSPGQKIVCDPNLVASLVSTNTVVKKGTFYLKFNPRLVKELSKNMKKEQNKRFTLPEEWEFRHFSIREFKTTFNIIQSMAYGWFIARQIACQKGVFAIGYNSALWTPKKDDLISKLVIYTRITRDKINKIIDYLTFGNAGIRNPDVAIQPLIDLRNDEYVISPFLWLNVNCERNLCVLLNQINDEKKIYSQLINEKEEKLRNEIISNLKDLGFEFKFGKLKDTDLDLAIIDRDKKKCLAIELKWFIEPAEIREVIQRSKEVKKGVQQACKIQTLWEINDKRLINEILDIDDSFDFLAIVAPVNSIGNFCAQDGKTPVVKCWHLIDEIKSQNDLSSVMEWLRKRDYLPKKDEDYKIESIPIKSGKWDSTWYGISYA